MGSMSGLNQEQRNKLIQARALISEVISERWEWAYEEDQTDNAVEAGSLIGNLEAANTCLNMVIPKNG